LCLAGWLCGLPLVFSILDFGGLLAWPAAYVSVWPAAGLPPLQTSCMDWTVAVGVIFIFYRGHSWLENIGTRGSCKVVGVS
jgi:hypothetical protein